MSNWKIRLQDSITLIIGAIIFFVLLVLGVYLLSYVIILVAIVGIIAFIIAQISSWFSGKKKPLKKGKDGHRTIDHDDKD